MLANILFRIDLWRQPPEALKQLMVKLTPADYVLLGVLFSLCLTTASLWLLLRFYQAKIRLGRVAREHAAALHVGDHGAILNYCRQTLQGLTTGEDDGVIPMASSMPSPGVSKSLLAQSYRHAFMTLRQLCVCAVHLQTLTGLLVLYTERYRLRPLPSGPPPDAVLATIHKLEHDLQGPLLALRRIEEPLVWRRREDMPESVQHFDADDFLAEATRTETALL